MFLENLQTGKPSAQMTASLLLASSQRLLQQQWQQQILEKAEKLYSEASMLQSLRLLKMLSVSFISEVKKNKQPTNDFSCWKMLCEHSFETGDTQFYSLQKGLIVFHSFLTSLILELQIILPSGWKWNARWLLP